LQLVERFGHAFAAEAVQAPEQHHAEASLVGILKELLELEPFRAASTFLGTVLLLNGVAQPRGKGPQWPLAFVLRRA
jgi:hypothetical protein